MAEVTNIEFSIDKDVANANISCEYDVKFDRFDQDANVPYELSWRLYGDDTGQDGDDDVHGDDPLSVVWRVGPLRSNGRESIHRSWSHTVPYDSLDEDKKLLFPPGRNDDEVLIKLTVTPQWPVAETFESQAQVLTAS